MAALRRPDQRGIDVGPRVDHRLHRDTGLHQIRGGSPSVVAGGENRGAASRRDAEPIEVCAHGGGHHDAGPVVAAEDEGPFHGPGGEYALPGNDFPQSLARPMRLRDGEMIRDALERAEGTRAAKAGVIGAEDRGAGHDLHARHRAQFRFDPPNPIAPTQVVDDVAVAVQPSSQDEILLAQDDSRARPAGRQCGCEARRTAADDQHIAKCVRLVISVGI